MYNYSNYGYTPYQQGFINPAQYPIQPQIQQTQPQGLNGKIVESIDIVKGTEIPFSGISFFPQADGTKIYTKQYMNDGRTKIDSYDLVTDVNLDNQISLEKLYSSIQDINKKIDLLQKPTPPASNRKKKVVEVDEYDE